MSPSHDTDPARPRTETTDDSIPTTIVRVEDPDDLPSTHTSGVQPGSMVVIFYWVYGSVPTSVVGPVTGPVSGPIPCVPVKSTHVPSEETCVTPPSPLSVFCLPPKQGVRAFPLPPKLTSSPWD